MFDMFTLVSKSGNCFGKAGTRRTAYETLDKLKHIEQ